jgi:hypothetical protein
MKRILAAAVATLGLLGSSGLATAAPPGDPAAQAAGQAAASGQAAGALSGAAQGQPANRNISVRVLSPGDAGDVTQSNTVSSNATAANANLTGQSAAQTQSGSCGCGEGGQQAIGQQADSSQAAAALSLATQAGASNTNIPVRVLSPGNDGDVSQTNSVESDATAANANATGQKADQAASGSGTQAIGQSADSEQDAGAASKAEQDGASNTNISVRVLSPGDDGSVDQSNTVDSSATAANLNLTGQSADQAQGGSGGGQAVGQKAKSDQDAGALSLAKQSGAKNTNIPVRVLSKGDGGDVTQSNSVDSKATAANLNATKQDADQAQRGGDCRCASDGTQAIGQESKNEQSAAALSAALQSGASNKNTPVRVGSYGSDGDVSQANTVRSTGTALNANLTKQDADQAAAADCRCGAGGRQAIGQSADSEQDALAASLAAQAAGRDKCGCASGGNTNAPVGVDGYGRGGGNVTQSNDVGSTATAGNLNALGQDADQGQAGGGTQAIGQEAKNEQAAIGLSAALQGGASNVNSPVAVAGKGGGGGDVSQANTVRSTGTALNANLTKQDADQIQRGSGECGCGHGVGIQAIGQSAKSEQGALAASLAAQLGASNENAPVSVGGYGGGGDVTQSNSVDSKATAGNLNALGQDAAQTQTGGPGIAIQAIGQEAKSEQAAIGLSAAFQSGASNASTPTAVGGKGKGGGGNVSQSNSVTSAAPALNLNLTKQRAAQEQGLACGCHGGVGIQALGQSAKSKQGALAASLAKQLGGKPCGCRSAPAPKWEPRKHHRLPSPSLRLRHE